MSSIMLRLRAHEAFVVIVSISRGEGEKTRSPLLLVPRAVEIVRTDETRKM